jgi:hypothetical protein
MADVRRNIDGGRRPLELPEELGEWRPRSTILADDDRRHSLAHKCERVTLLEKPTIVVTVRIDETRSEGQPSCVDDAVAGTGAEPPDIDDAIADDPHGSRTRRRATAIEHACIHD